MSKVMASAAPGEGLTANIGASLTAIARMITGGRRSTPRFFGLREVGAGCPKHGRREGAIRLSRTAIL